MSSRLLRAQPGLRRINQRHKISILSAPAIASESSSTSRSYLGPSSSFSSSSSTNMPALSPQTINSAFITTQYAVRGELAVKAEKYREMLKEGGDGAKSLPFDKVVNANIGNPQQKGLDQKPLTFARQIAALTEYTDLLDSEAAKASFPPDVIERAKELYREIGSVGAYSHSQGVLFIRKNVAKFIEARDGYPSDPNHIFLTAGASAGVSLMLNMLISHPKAGILIPIPQYPLYTASLAQHNGTPVPYYLDESKNWSTDPTEVERAVLQGQKEGVEVKALVVINPGNPTGAMLTEQTMEDLVRLCEKHGLVLLADEVYQDNLHQRQNHPWTSFKKVVRRLDSNIPLVSFHSISKGVTGECGRRGGYFELTNVSEEIIALVYKMVSVTLCPPLGGQIGVDCLVRPPQPGQPSYDLWKSETDAIHKVLAKRSNIMTERLNKLPGMSCAISPGALYLYPRIYLPEKAVQAAKAEGKEPDMFYSHALLDETGICVTPGSGFGQKEGEGHFRLTILCDGVEEYVGQLEKFHKGFMAKYA